MKKAITLEIIGALLIILFLYAAFSKYADLALFKRSMQMQRFPRWLMKILIITLPLVEILISIGLMITKTRRLSLYAFVTLMAIFSGYIFALLVKWIPKRPCSCGGVITVLSWEQHFVLNLAFVFLGIWAIILQKQLKKQNLVDA